MFELSDTQGLTAVMSENQEEFYPPCPIFSLRSPPPSRFFLMELFYN